MATTTMDTVEGGLRSGEMCTNKPTGWERVIDHFPLCCGRASLFPGLPLGCGGWQVRRADKFFIKTHQSPAFPIPVQLHTARDQHRYTCVHTVHVHKLS